MPAYSHTSYATREQKAGERTHVIKINHGHPLSNEGRPPYARGPLAARMLLTDLERRLVDPDKGPAVFNSAYQLYKRASEAGQRMNRQSNTRQQNAAAALAAGDVDLNSDQLQLMVDIQIGYQKIGDILLREVTSPEQAETQRIPDGVVGIFDKIDHISRGAIRASIEQRDGNDNALITFQQQLIDRLNAVEEGNHTADVVELVHNIARLEASVKHYVQRDEIAYEIDDMLDPVEVAAARDRIAPFLDAALNPVEAAALTNEIASSPAFRNMTRKDARAAVRQTLEAANNPNLSEEEREAERTHAANMVALWALDTNDAEFDANYVILTDRQRAELAIQMINSTPSLVRIPEVENGVRPFFDIVMGSIEEARVVETLIHWAGESRHYPGPEAVRDYMDSIKEISMPSGTVAERHTIGLAVNSSASSVQHAMAMISASTPDVRLLIHLDNPDANSPIARQLLDARIARLAEFGQEPNFLDSSNATRQFGGWSLPDDGQSDYLLGATPRDAQIFVANADIVTAYVTPNDLNHASLREQINALEDAKAALIEEDKALAIVQARLLDSRNPELVAQAEALRALLENARSGQDSQPLSPAELDDLRSRYNEADFAADASSDPKLVALLERSMKARSTAYYKHEKAKEALKISEEKSVQDAFRTSAPGDLARAQIVDLAQQHGKLFQVYSDAPKDAESRILTAEGPGLIKIRNYVAQRDAQRLRSGDRLERANLRRLFHSQAGVDANVIVGSNFFSAQKGAAEGLAEMKARVEALPPTSIVMVYEDPDLKFPNQVVDMISGLDRTRDNVLHAVAWRISSEQRADIEGRKITLREKTTELDLGTTSKLVPSEIQGEKPKSVGSTRRWSYSDLKGLTVVVHGGGSMDRATWNALQEFAKEQGRSAHAMSTAAVREAVLKIQETKPWIKMPDIANPALARAIAQEALIDYGTQVIVASDMGRDYNSATFIRLAAEADKLAAVIGKDGQPIDIAAAYDNALPYAKNIADNTRDTIKPLMEFETGSLLGQSTLTSISGITPSMAKAMSEDPRFATLQAIQHRAQEGIVTPFFPKSLHHSLSLQTTWKNALDKAGEVRTSVERLGLQSLTPADEHYPAKILETGRARPIYAMGNGDLNKPTLALIVGGEKKPNTADLDAIRTIAAEAREKDWAVSLHMHGTASIETAKALAAMPEETRPDILLIGDGYPIAYRHPGIIEAVAEVGKAGGGYVTPVAPIQTNDRPTAIPLEAALEGRTDSALGQNLLRAFASEANGERETRDNQIVQLSKAEIEAITETYPTLRDIREAIEGGAETPAIPAGFKEAMSKESNWKEAVDIAQDTPEYAINRAAGIAFHAQQASAIAIVKASGADQEVLGLKAAIDAHRPIAVVAPSEGKDRSLDDLRFLSAGYSANARMLAGGDKLSVVLDSRGPAFIPNFVSDIGEEMKARESVNRILFEAGKTRLQQEDNRLDRSQVESGPALRQTIEWSQAAHPLPEGQGTGAFLYAVEAGEARDLQVTEAMRVKLSLENDRKYLDTSHRFHGRSTEEQVHQMFSEITERSANDIEMEADHRIKNPNNMEENDHYHYQKRRGGMEM